MPSSPCLRRPLRIELPRPARASPSPVRRPPPGRSHARAVVAVEPPGLRELMALGLRAFQIDQRWVRSRAGLYEEVAHGREVLILSDPFDDAPAHALLAAIRTAGVTIPAVVIGHASRPLRARLAALGPITLVPDPTRADAAAGEPWLRRCVSAFL